jgi:very-short-patch-repair endonuclease
MATLRGKDQRRTERTGSLRRALTPAEFLLWTRIRGRQLGGLNFVRQEPIGRYYVNFVCRDRRLIVELDGGQHAERPEDRQRIANYAPSVILSALWSNNVIDNFDRVRQTLQSELEKWPLTPALSPLAATGFTHLYS